VRRTPPAPQECNLSINLYGAFKKNTLVACTKAADPNPCPPSPQTNPPTFCCPSNAYKIVPVPQAGVIVQLVDANTLSVRKEVVTNASGTVVFKFRYSDITPGNQYKVRAKYSSGKFPDSFRKSCSNSDTVYTDGYCLVDLSSPRALSAGSSFSIVAKTVPDAASGGFGGEIGNANGDNAVNLFDLSAIKAAFGHVQGDQCYKPWADFDLNGTVNLFDLSILKAHIGQQIDTTPPASGGDFDPVLVQSKDPLPACCKTSPPTCQ